MTRKEQKELRQKQIMFKALELFVTKGFSETKISDIAAALDISVGLLVLKGGHMNGSAYLSAHLL